MKKQTLLVVVAILVSFSVPASAGFADRWQKFKDGYNEAKRTNPKTICRERFGPKNRDETQMAVFAKQLQQLFENSKHRKALDEEYRFFYRMEFSSRASSIEGVPHSFGQEVVDHMKIYTGGRKCRGSNSFYPHIIGVEEYIKVNVPTAYNAMQKAFPPVR